VKEKELKITVYEPNLRARTGWVKTWVTLVKNAISSWDLIYQLFRRDFLMQYKKSFLGMGWLIIAPIMGIISWVFMNATGVLTPGDVGIPYPAYVLLSTSIFGLFSAFYSGASGTLSSGAGFINQVNYPHDIMLVKQTLQVFSNFLITFAINIVVLLAFGVVPSWMIILFPILIIPMALLGASIGLMTSLIAIVTPDLTRAISFVMGLLMYITPVIYSPNVENELLQQVIKYNPLTYLVGGVRDAIIYGKIDHFDLFLYSSAGSIVLFLISWRIFYVAEEKVIERMI